jgi:uridine kinase
VAGPSDPIGPADAGGPARDALRLALARPPTLGDGRLVCIDGPSGSGKTTLATAVGAGATIVHMDDLYEGWDGLPTVGAQLESLLRPLAAGEPGRYRRYDWHRGELAETVTVAPTPLLVLEGVGSGSLEVADLTTVLVWVEAPLDIRMRRGLDRDGESFAPYWEAWAPAEQEHFAWHRTQARADLVVTTG